MFRAAVKWIFIALLVITVGGGISYQLTASEHDKKILSACWSMVWAGFRR